MPAAEIMGAAVTAGVGAVGKEAFAYNRENYMFDQGLRFSRFNTGYSMAMAQASQYREDISDLTELTVTKADAYHTVGTICFVLNFQLIMAGRLGVHGPSPPGWLLGLYWTNICAALMFLVTFTWMAMHSGARATAGAAHMRTRSVRLPIPTPAMLDKARCTGNSFEKQRVADIFRIPFAMPAGKETVEDPELGVHVPVAGSDRRMPKWYRDEVRDLRKDEGGAAPSPTSVPEHFELYRGLQEEWWAYDVYGRIGILFFFSHWLTSASLYSMCHVFTELRCMWPAWTVVACFVTAHYGILQLDITSKPREGALMCMPIERVVPFVPVLCVLGMSIDYSVLAPSAGAQGFIYVLSCIAYLIQFAWALRLYELAAPQTRLSESPEYAGEAWSPMEWPVPPAFSQAVYLVAAPKYLEPGQTCLQQEMKAAKGDKGQVVPQKKARSVPPQTLPWKLFRGACITMISMWVLIIFGRAFEMVNGERWLLKQENRVERWPTHMQPWMTPWTRRGRRDEWCHAGGCDRRLDAQSDAAMSAARLATALERVADAMDSTVATSQPEQMEKSSIRWPAGLEPAVVTARGDSLAAVDRRGRGAIISGDAAIEFQIKASNREVEIHSASWGEAGLTLVTPQFDLLECLGEPVDGVWACRQLPSQLPPRVRVAAAARRADGTLRVAVAFDGEDSVVLFDELLGEWVPVGEIQSQLAAADFSVALAGHGEALLLTSPDGSVVQRGIDTTGGVKVVPSAGTASMSWHGACSMDGGRLARVGSDALYISGARH